MISRGERIAFVILSVALIVFGVMYYSVARETYLLKKDYNAAMEAYQEINRSYPFAPEEHERIGVDQCKSFFQIQQRLFSDPTFRTMLAPGARMYGGKAKGRLWVSVAPTHQHALFDMRMSFIEYQYVTSHILTAILVGADQKDPAALNTLTAFHTYIGNLRFHQAYVQKLVDSMEKRLRGQSSPDAASEIESVLGLLEEHPVPPEVMHFYFLVLQQDLHLLR